MAQSFPVAVDTVADEILTGAAGEVLKRGVGA
jgi:hypothetical protein